MSLKKQIVLLSLAILIVSAVPRWWPYSDTAKNNLLFDEVAYVANIQNYLRGNDFFTVVPPLGKLLIYKTVLLFDKDAKVKAASVPPSYIIEKKAIELAPINIYYYRLIPMILGTIVPLLLFKTLLSLAIEFHISINKLALIIFSFIGFLFALDNAFITESRTVSMTQILLFFILCTILLSVKLNRKSKDIIHYLIIGISIGLMVSVKWYAIFSIPIVIYLFNRHEKFNLNTVSKALLTLIIAILSYFFIFCIHFSILKNRLPPNPGERKTVFSEEIISLQINSHINNYFERFIEQHKNVLFYQKGMDKYDNLSGRWNEWPLMIKPVLLTSNVIVPENFKKTEILDTPFVSMYLIGNPIVWALSFFGLILSIITVATRFYSFFMKQRIHNDIFFVLSILYLFNWIPYAFVKNKLYIYTYIPALCFAMMVMLLYANDFFQKRKFSKKMTYFVLVSILVFSTIGFFLYKQFTYGESIKYKDIVSRELLTQWKLVDNTLAIPAK